MKALNAAQQLLIVLGVPETSVMFAHRNGVAGGRRRHSNTKRGPGRIHHNGKIEER